MSPLVLCQLWVDHPMCPDGLSASECNFEEQAALKVTCDRWRSLGIADQSEPVTPSIVLCKGSHGSPAMSVRNLKLRKLEAGL